MNFMENALYKCIIIIIIIIIIVIIMGGGVNQLEPQHGNNEEAIYCTA